jgi:hypothetical protein
MCNCPAGVAAKAATSTCSTADLAGCTATFSAIGQEVGAIDVAGGDATLATLSDDWRILGFTVQKNAALP